MEERGLKYLGVFLGEESVLEKNWENVLEKIEGRLKKWKWLLPSMSYRGRTLVINNLVSSSLWHRLACADPPSNLLARIQAVLVDFFWDKLHWIPQALLFLPKEEAGQGLIHLASRGAAFRLQFVQRLLYGPRDLVWRPLAHTVLQQFSGLGLHDSLFLMDLKTVKFKAVPPFYRGVFTVWKMLVKERLTRNDSLHWLLQEPVVYGGHLDTPCWAGSALMKMFCRAGVLTFGSVVNIAGPNLDNAAALASSLGVRSVRIVSKLLEHWKHRLTGHECLLLNDYCNGLVVPHTDDPFPCLGVWPSLENCAGPVFDGNSHICLNLEEAKGKPLYRMMVSKWCLKVSK